MAEQTPDPETQSDPEPNPHKRVEGIVMVLFGTIAGGWLGSSIGAGFGPVATVIGVVAVGMLGCLAGERAEREVFLSGRSAEERAEHGKRSRIRFSRPRSIKQLVLVALVSGLIFTSSAYRSDMRSRDEHWNTDVFLSAIPLGIGAAILGALVMWRVGLLDNRDAGKS